MPTAAGKTTLIDIAVYALGMGATGAARRVFFVVDRRIVVEEAAERAAQLADKLSRADHSSPLGEFAQALRNLGGDPNPLETATLRGGIPRDSSWTESPLQPTVICSTVDQVGSSLLFRAYGASDYSRPIRGALAGYDSLIILDEAHTSQPFAETLSLIRNYRDWAEQKLNGPFAVVEMSATPRAGQAFHEQHEDREHPVLKKRWEAEKRARLVAIEPKPNEEAAKGGFTALIDRLVEEACSMREHYGAKVIGVIANRVLTARRIHEALSRHAQPAEVLLLTGRARPYDRDQLWQKWRDSIGFNRRAEPDLPIFVVATQCIEVGANIDFDALVTEIASLDALEQRFGRLNRSGKKAVSHAAIVAQRDQTQAKYEDPIYGGAIVASWAWLKDHLRKEERNVPLPVVGKKKRKTNKVKDEFVAMGVLALRQALQSTNNREVLTMPRRHAPVLMPAHMDLLCQTSPEPAVSPEPSIFLHGPEASPADVQVIWRQDLEEHKEEQWAKTVAICPPSAAETIAVPIWAVRNWLQNRDSPDLADLEGSPGEDAQPAGEEKPVLQWRGADESEILENPQDIRPGTTIIAPATYGGCDEWGWNPSSLAEVTDVGDAVKLLLNRPMLRLDPKLAARWGYSELAQRLQSVERLADARTALTQASTPQAAVWCKEAVEALRTSQNLKFVANSNENTESWAAITGRGAFEQESIRASYTAEVPLEQHLNGCEKWAKTFARDLPGKLRKTVSSAAKLHDIGKADPRFQAWLRGGNPIKAHELIAKSKRSGQDYNAIQRARKLAGYPEGGRHELLSVALLQDHHKNFSEYDFDLVLHLIGSHHGRCRPFAPVVDDPEPLMVTYNGLGASSDHKLERANSGVTERFWRLTRRYGWYGLAYLEALLRLADQSQSEEEQNARS